MPNASSGKFQQRVEHNCYEKRNIDMYAVTRVTPTHVLELAFHAVWITNTVTQTNTYGTAY